MKKAGLSDVKIAAQFGCSYQTVVRWRQRYGVEST